MSDLNLNQIQTRLNELFVSYGERKLIFWFDPKKEFEEDIDNGGIVLENAIIKKLEPNTQFLTKRFFEIEDKDNNYLVYAPFKRMEDNDQNNHLLSVLKYSTLFNADRTSLVMTQLNIPAELHDVMEIYNKFFGAKSRISAFEKLSSNEIRTKEELETTMMAVLTKANTAQFYSVVQALLVEYSAEESTLYEQLENFGLKVVFWEAIEKYYGYSSDAPSIQKLVISFFANSFYGQLGQQELPKSLKEYEVLEQTTAIVSFMDGVMNDSRYSEAFDKLSRDTYHLISGDQLVAKAPIEELLSADIFESIHQKVVNYFISQLLSGDTTPVVNGLSLGAIVKKKKRAHFGQIFTPHYQAVLNAQELLNYTMQTNLNEFSTVVKDYESSSYQVDQFYRNFIWNLDQIDHKENFQELQNIVEKQYKAFLDEIGRVWNDLLNIQERTSMLDFYDKFAKEKTKTVVIISDALRYEVGKEIQKELEQEKKYATKMETFFSVLPSVTEFGKAASLRSGTDSFCYIDGTDVRINDMKTNGTENRDKILKAKNPNSLAVTYEQVMAKQNSKELRELFNGQEVIYLYHDQIDKTGDHGQESQVFDAVEKTISELRLLIQRISNGANVHRFIITGDHGFIYTRSEVAEHEKIENPSMDSSDRIERRFIISNHQYDEIGVSRLKLGDVLRNSDERFVHYPQTSAIFKKAGGGQSYVHGGSSPQEMLVPVLEVAVSRGSATKEMVEVQLMTTKRKIVGLSVALEFYQNEAVSDSVMKAQYAIYFEDETGNRISNENTYYADSTSINAGDRFTNFTFDFVNRNYGNNEKVYLIVKDSKTNVECQRTEFIVDNPFAGDFGFDF